jgi:hypothetical protein
MLGLKRVGVVAAGLAVGLAGCRSTCGDQARYQNCNTCDPGRYAVAPRAVGPAPCGSVVSSGPRAPVIGAPVSSGPFGVPYAPVVPAVPNELPPPMETIPAPGIPTAGAANVLPLPSGPIPPVTQSVGLSK